MATAKKKRPSGPSAGPKGRHCPSFTYLTTTENADAVVRIPACVALLIKSLRGDCQALSDLIDNPPDHRYSPSHPVVH
jgi:hypothetical protein